MQPVDTQQSQHAGSNTQSRRIEDTPLGVPFAIASEYVAAPRWAHVMMAGWPAHTHAFQAMGVTPRLHFAAEGPGCGKTTAGTVTAYMSAKPVIVGRNTPAWVWVKLDEQPGSTLMLDQCENLWGTNGRRRGGSDALLAAVDSGYTAGNPVGRVTNGKAVDIDVFTPMILAGIGSIPDTLADRAVEVTLVPAIPREIYLPGMGLEDPLKAIGQDLGEWVGCAGSLAYLVAYRHEHPLADVAGLPRFRQIMAPLEAVFHLAGCGDEFTQAVKEMQAKDTKPNLPPVHVMLLADLRECWPGDATLVRAQEAIAALRKHPSRRWDNLTPNRIGEIRLAGLLRDSGVESKVRNGERGYLADDVFPALPPELGG